MPTINYSLRKPDILEFNEHHARMNSAYGKNMTRHQVTWPTVTVVLALLVVMSTGNVVIAVLMFIGAFVWSLVVPAWIKKRFKRQIVEHIPEENLAKITGEYSLTATPEGLLENSPMGEKCIEWATINRLEESKHHVYLYLTDVAAIIVPQETLSKDSNFNAFYVEVIEALKDAKTNAS
jgi:hypothetical protein